MNLYTATITTAAFRRGQAEAAKLRAAGVEPNWALLNRLADQEFTAGLRHEWELMADPAHRADQQPRRRGRPATRRRRRVVAALSR